MQGQNIESGVQLFTRTNNRSIDCLKSINCKLFPDGGPLSNQIVEIESSDHSDSLLLDFLIRCILPKDLNDEWKDCGVLFVNTEHHINILRVVRAMEALLKHSQIKNKKTVIEKALKNLVILNCFTPEEFTLSLHGLAKPVMDKDNINISLVLIDNIAAHYWIHASASSGKLSFDAFVKSNLQMVQKSVKDLGLVVIFSRDQTSNKYTDPSIDYKITSNKNESKNQFTVKNFATGETTVAPFDTEMHLINFL